MATVLALDISGVPRQWISIEDAIKYHATNSVAWSLGDVVAKFRGGTQNDGTESYIESSSIIAISGQGFDMSRHASVPLTNKTLFGRDRYLCVYCGKTFHYNDLSRDHIVPRYLGGENTWMNVATCCKDCNSRKGHKTLKEAKLELRYVPYVPNHYEHLLLQGRNILTDQMDYLLAGIPKKSRLHGLTLQN